MVRQLCVVCTNAYSKDLRAKSTSDLNGVLLGCAESEFICGACARRVARWRQDGCPTLPEAPAQGAVDWRARLYASRSPSFPSTAVPASPPLPAYALTGKLPKLKKLSEFGCCCCGIKSYRRFYWRQNQWFKDKLLLEHLRVPESPHICSRCARIAAEDVNNLSTPVSQLRQESRVVYIYYIHATVLSVLVCFANNFDCLLVSWR